MLATKSETTRMGHNTMETAAATEIPEEVLTRDIRNNIIDYSIHMIKNS